MMNHFLTEKADRLSVFGQLLASLAKGKTLLLKRTFAKRRSRYKKLGKKVPQAYRVYVEDTFLPCDAVDARIFAKEEERAMMATTSPILKMLNEKIDVLALSPVERKLYESRMKLKSDIATISDSQFNAGRQEGKLETAILMKQANCESTFIEKMTGLSADEIAQL